MSFLNDIRKFCRKRLKPVDTQLETPDGRRLVETKDKSGETTTRLVGRGGLGFVRDLRPDLQIATVIPGLSLGSQDPSSDIALLRRHNVTHILNLATGIENAFEGSFSYLRIEILDLPDVDIRRTFSKCFRFIDDAILGGTGHVFVHCNAGISRSATVVVAYLMRRRKMRYRDALESVRTARPAVRPNDGFTLQLQAFDEELYGKRDP